MNNAANNIEAQSRSLKDVLYEKHYKVGYFQREYKWKRNNIEDLLVDLERSFNSNWATNDVQKDVASYDKYYMGPIVLFMDGSEYSIVDGQQRLTSFVLLMIYLNHKYKEVVRVKDKFIGYIYSEHYGSSSYNMNIPERNDVLKSLNENVNYDVSILKNESCKAILERYHDIVELFPKSLLNEKVLPLFGSWITEKLVFVEIITQTSESAYTIFETMNDRGLNLTQTELLKSFLLSNVRDEKKIKELDAIWKNRISVLNTIDDDQDFFKAWLRAKYAVTIRTSEKDSENKDFEKIGTRFSSWTQENTKIKEGSESKLLLDSKDSESFYFFVKSDFNFFSELYIKVKKFEKSEIPEHRFKLVNYKGVSPSLSYPLILSPIQKADNEETINAKIDTVIKYIDCFAVYRMLLLEPITHGSIRNAMYLKVKDIRNLDLPSLQKKLSSEIDEYKLRYLKQDNTIYDSDSKYILSRLFISKNPQLGFENVYFLRRRDSYTQYQFLKVDDFDSAKHGLPQGLKDRYVSALCSYTMVPRQMVSELDSLDIIKRITKLIKMGCILEFNDLIEFDSQNLKAFFINREKRLKQSIVSLWKI